MSDDAGEMPDDGLGDDGEGGGKKSKKKLIIIIVVLVLLVGGGAGAYMSGMLPFGGGGEEEAHASGEHGESEAHGASAEGHGEGEHADEGEGRAEGLQAPVVHYYKLPEFLINLQTTGTKPSFLKLVVALEMPSQESVTQIETVKPRIVDSFQVYLRELRPSDLKGSAGIYRLREELLLRIRKAAHPIPVNDILFEELIVQ